MKVLNAPSHPLLTRFLSTGEVINNDDAKVVPPSAIMMEVSFGYIGLYYYQLFKAVTFTLRYFFLVPCSLQSAIAWFLLYYLILKPLKLLTIDDDYTERLRAVGLYSRFSFFEVLSCQKLFLFNRL